MNLIKGIKILALIFPGLAIAILLVFTVGETAGEKGVKQPDSA